MDYNTIMSTLETLLAANERNDEMFARIKFIMNYVDVLFEDRDKLEEIREVLAK